MTKPPRGYLILACLALLAIFIGYQAIFKWPAEKQGLAKQQKLIEAIESRKWGRVHRLVSDHYGDSLELDRENLLLALRDLGSQFWTMLELNWEMTDLQRDGDAIVITGKLRLDGEGGMFAPMAVQHARPFANKPFTFRWRKAGTMPWSWRLDSIHHPDARLPDGYVPGELRRRTGFGEF